jgi:hypothetical protein
MSDTAGEPIENASRSVALSALSDDERSQVSARLRLSPAERLRYLLDILAFEDLARRARRIG